MGPSGSDPTSPCTVLLSASKNTGNMWVFFELLKTRRLVVSVLRRMTLDGKVRSSHRQCSRTRSPALMQPTLGDDMGDEVGNGGEVQEQRRVSARPDLGGVLKLTVRLVVSGFISDDENCRATSFVVYLICWKTGSIKRCQQKRMWSQRRKQGCGDVGDTAGHVSTVCQRLESVFIFNLTELSATIFFLHRSGRVGGREAATKPPKCKALWAQVRESVRWCLRGVRASNFDVLRGTDAQTLTFKLVPNDFAMSRAESCDWLHEPHLANLWSGFLRMARTNMMVNPCPLQKIGRSKVTPVKNHGRCGPCWLLHHTFTGWNVGPEHRPCLQAIAVRGLRQHGLWLLYKVEVPVHRKRWHMLVVKLHCGSLSWWRCRFQECEADLMRQSVSVAIVASSFELCMLGCAHSHVRTRRVRGVHAVATAP